MACGIGDFGGGYRPRRLGDGRSSGVGPLRSRNQPHSLGAIVLLLWKNKVKAPTSVKKGRYGTHELLNLSRVKFIKYLAVSK